MNATCFLETILREAIKSFGWDFPERVQIEPPREKKFGDIATNIAMLLSKKNSKIPQEILLKRLRIIY